MVIYDEKKEKIIDEYKQYIENFGSQLINEKKGENTEYEEIINRKECPSLFVSGYSRKCKVVPTIIKKNDEQLFIDSGKKVIEFPRYGEDKRFYYCNDDIYKFPGLSKNKLSNKDLYPEIPCCFMTDQSEGGKNHALYQKYYFDIDIENKTTTQQKIITTNKILARDSIGELPYTIKQFFSINTIDTDKHYVRKGMSKLENSKSSFLMAILEAIGDKQMYEKRSDEDIILYLNNIRKQLSDDLNNTSLCKQELYDYTSEEIKNNISNPLVNLEATLYSRLLEHKYNCNIFIFNETGMILPRYLYTHYKYDNKKNNIMIYQHIGSERDNLTYLQYELIIKIKRGNIYDNKNNSCLMIHKHNSGMSRYLNNTFNTLNKSYTSNNNLVNIFEINNMIKPYAQSIDNYGKCRRIDVLLNKQQITIFTDPLPPLKLPEIYITDSINKISSEIALKIFTILKIKPQYQYKKKVVSELFGIHKNIKFSIPLLTNEPLIKNIPNKKEVLSYSDKYNSNLQKFTTNKKIDRYLVEYT